MDLLRHDYGLRLARADEQAYAALADGREMELLELTCPHAVLRTERTAFLGSGDIIEFSQATYRGDSYRLTMALEALATTGTPGRRQ